MVASVAAALLIVPVWFSTTVDYIRSRGDVTAGFALPGFNPPELLGFMRMVTPRPSSARVIWSAISVVTIGSLAFIVRTSYRRLVRYCAVFAVLVFASYAAIYRREHGPSYRQWKWITFFQPMLVVMVVAIGSLALERIASSRRSRRRGVAVLTAACFGVIVSTNTGSGIGTALRDRRRFRRRVARPLWVVNGSSVSHPRCR